MISAIAKQFPSHLGGDFFLSKLRKPRRALRFRALQMTEIGKYWCFNQYFVYFNKVFCLFFVSLHQ